MTSLLSRYRVHVKPKINKSNRRNKDPFLYRELLNPEDSNMSTPLMRRQHIYYRLSAATEEMDWKRLEYSRHYCPKLRHGVKRILMSKINAIFTAHFMYHT